MHTARSIANREYLNDFFRATPFSQMLEPPSNTGRFSSGGQAAMFAIADLKSFRFATYVPLVFSLANVLLCFYADNGSFGERSGSVRSNLALDAERPNQGGRVR
jgi:hypothetical protein